MKYNNKIYFLFILFSVFLRFGEGWGGASFAQNKNIDSLLILLKKDQPDANKVTHFNKLSKEYLNIDFYDSAIYFANQALALANYLPFEKGRGWEVGVADAAANLGIIYLSQDNYSGAIDHFLKSLKIYEKLKNKHRIANLKGNIGIVYKKQGEYLKALEYYFNAQKLYEEMGDKIDIAVNFGNIANVYRQQSEYTKALKYYFESQKIYEELELKKNIGLTFGNIGGVYFNQGDYPKALEYIFHSLRIAEELGDKRGTATHLGNIGNVFQDQARAITTSHKKSDELFSKALAYYFKALKMHEELGSKNFVASNINRISSVYACMKKYKEAFDYSYQALTLSENIGAKEIVKDCYNNLSLLYENSTIPLPDS
ncbi:MAG: tetratricopeptide repeat protein, partial [Bacteroidota bacterium]|nr:tetratricopeptide repeat protein [Bacteroidota bacterium]